MNFFFVPSVFTVLQLHQNRTSEEERFKNGALLRKNCQMGKFVLIVCALTMDKDKEDTGRAVSCAVLGCAAPSLS